MKHFMITIDGLTFACTGCPWWRSSRSEKTARENHARHHDMLYINEL